MSSFMVFLRKSIMVIILVATTLSTALQAANKIDSVSKPIAVTTFASIGITLAFQGDDNKNALCNIKYRLKGNEPWQIGFPLWRDDKRQEFRGSIVQLTAGNNYEIELTIKDPDGTPITKNLTAKTWDDKFPIAKTITISGQALKQGYAIKESGSVKGYVLYITEPGTVIDVARQQESCLTVDAHHIIIRGMTLKGAKKHAIDIKFGHDIVIEKCDISDWGSIAKDGWGYNVECAIYSQDRQLVRVIIQRNVIHHPYSNSNNWTEARIRNNKSNKHPAGPQAVGFWDSSGNHVIRYNHVYSDPKHYYNDIFGCGANFSLKGFPNANSDIYGNILENSWDDAIEVEGANLNVRVWGNYIKNALKTVASRVSSIGPLYIWRNIAIIGYQSPGNHKSASFHKSGGRRKRWDNGVFVFHNTAVMPNGENITGSGSRGIEGAMLNTTTSNNILAVERSIISELKQQQNNYFINDLCAGKSQNLKFAVKATPIQGKPKFSDKFGLNRKTGKGIFYQSPQSPGYNRGVKLPGFNSNTPDGKPDIGAHEAGTPPMEFGPQAYSKQ